MKIKKNLIRAILVYYGMMSFNSVFSQDEAESKFNTGADLYSNFIWRGSKYGTGPAIQPAITFLSGGLTIGAWGSFDFNGYQESDLYFFYRLPFGFDLGLTDYYYPTLSYFDYSRATGSHAVEINAGLTSGKFSLDCNYIINHAGGAGSAGGDKYIQAGYSFRFLNIFLGAGDGWHTFNSSTGNDNFAICNVGLGTSKTIRVTDSFNIPVTGQIILNPDKKQLFIVVGFTL